MHELFARPGSGSVVVEVLLEEAGLPYEVETVERGLNGRFPDSFYRISPLGQVPALKLPDGSVMTESAAIAIFLADRYPQMGLAPKPDSSQRPHYLRWLVFLAANIYMTDLRIYYNDRYTSDPKGAEAVKTAATAQMAQEWDIFAAALGRGPFILGAEPSVVDIYAAMLATWNLDVAAFFRKHRNISDMYDRVTARPAVAKVWARNEMDAWKLQAASA